MDPAGSAAPGGRIGLRIIRPGAAAIERVPGRSHHLPGSDELWRAIRDDVRVNGRGRRGLAGEVNAWRQANRPHLRRGLRRARLALRLDLPTLFGALHLRRIDAHGRELYLGLASLRVITNAGVNFIVDAFQNLTEAENLKFHGLGTGTLAESSGDTALGTEVTTQYSPDNTRATGTTTEGASANIYRTVGTNTLDGAAAVTEHGIFSQAAAPGGTLLDRSVFAVVNLLANDSLETTYDLTITSGG